MKTEQPQWQPTSRRARPAWLVYAMFFAVTAMAASVGALFGPGTWYAGLAKPPWNPPNWLFAPVWTALYIMIAIAGARALLCGASQLIVGLWGIQLVLNAAWTWLFFGLHRPDLALVDIGLLVVAIAAFAWRVWPVSRVSTLLFLPYLAWVGFASTLNAAIWRLNG